jgi:hypothetical protein
MTATWTGGGSGNSWSEAANWSTPSVPLNASDTYQVVIPTGHTVNTSGVPADSEIDSLTLAYGSSLDVVSGSELTVLGTADIAGALTASGGTFTAGDQSTTLSGGLASVVALAGGAIEFMVWYLWTGMQSITAGANEGDELAITATNATIDLSSLQSIRSAGRGITRITANSGGAIYFCAITELEQVILDVSGGSALEVCESPLAYSSDQMYSSLGSNTADIIRASGSDTSFNLWTLVSLDAGFDDGSASHVNVQRIVAAQGHTLNLWNLQQVTTPIRAEDSLEFVIEDGGRIQADALDTILSEGSGSLGFSTTGGSGELRLGDLASIVPTRTMVTGTVDVDGDVILGGTSGFSVASSDVISGTVSVGGDVTLSGASHFSVGSSGTLSNTMSVGGDVSFDFSDASQLDLANAILQFDAGPDPQYLEVGGLDVGTDTGSLSDDNFGLGRLVVGTGDAPAANLELVDQVDNGNRAGGARRSTSSATAASTDSPLSWAPA